MIPRRKSSLEDRWGKNFTPSEEKRLTEIYQELVPLIKPQGPDDEKVMGCMMAAVFLEEKRSRSPRYMKKRPSALKHGGYSQTTVLEGEDPKQFEKLHRDL